MHFTEVQSSNLVGKWRWYKTDIEQWFDVGPSNFYEVTPQSEGFEYYFIISEDGKFKGYKNDTLVHEWIFNKTSYQNIDGDTMKTITFNLDCTNLKLSFSRLPYSYNLDTLATRSYPIQFDDEQNHLRTHRNYFSRE